VDFARGLIQHRIFLTSYLRKQTESRQLEAPVNRGRIYRIVSTSKPVKRHNKLSAQPDSDTLINRLSNPNGFWRDTAQRLLAERNEPGLADRLRPLVSFRTARSSLGRLHTLWTLEALGSLDLATIRTAFHDPDPMVAASAVRAAEPFLRGPRAKDFFSLFTGSSLPAARRTQLAILLTFSGIDSPEAEAATRALMLSVGTNRLWQTAAISGLKHRELPFLQWLATSPPATNGTDSVERRTPLLGLLAQCVANEADGNRVGQFCDFVATPTLDARLRTPLVAGFISGLQPLPKDKNTLPRQILIPEEPKAFLELRTSLATNEQALVDRVSLGLSWPGKVRPAGMIAAAPLNATEQASYNRGKELYTTICGACHQPHGRGQEGLAPPLLNSEWVLGSNQRLIRIVLHGVRDAITVGGTKYALNMPALGEALTDEQIADALTYVRHEWGHTAPAVSPELVKGIRATESKRDDSWTEPELLKQP
ncbi:MAG TPA: cytochrome c, partial [Candidatus Limnocylindria bacterium]|nr:cytochrome c [Candidatus Limnocylindria bacterium]